MDAAIPFLLPAGCVIAAWWAGTSIILRLDRMPARTFARSLFVGGAIAATGLAAIAASAPHVTPMAAYAGFLGALAVWAWVEMAFLTGAVVGPRRGPCPPARGWARFVYAVEAILYHEIALLIAFGLVAAASWAGPNRVALWTFAVLWVMRLCAKLNIHFGVPNSGEELLPPRLRYLGSYFQRGPFTVVYPATVGMAVLVAMPLWQMALAHGGEGFDGVQATIVATLLSLAIAEHLFMVLPISQTALWKWGLKGDEPGGRESVTPAVQQGKGSGT